MGKDTLNRWHIYHSAKAGAHFTSVCCLLWGFLLLTSASIVEGQVSLTVRSVGFEGNRLFSTNQLLASLITRKGGIFSESVLSSDLEHILDRYKNQAYLHTRVDSMWANRDTIRHDVDVRIFLTEGKPSIIRHIELEGCHNITTAELYTIMQLHVRRSIHPFNLRTRCSDNSPTI